MNNDLISRSALKKALKEKFDDFIPEGVYDEIDNAPTVEAVPLEHHNKIKGILDNEVKSLVDILDNERSKGEWIRKEVEYLKQKEAYDLAIKALEERQKGEWRNWIKVINGYGDILWKCNKCKHFVKNGDDRNFCPNCGADMRGGAE